MRRNQSFYFIIFKRCGTVWRFNHLKFLSHSLDGDSKTSSTIFSKAALACWLVNSCASRYIWCEILFILSCAIQAACFLTVFSRVDLGANPYTNTQSSWSAIFSRVLMVSAPESSSPPSDRSGHRGRLHKDLKCFIFLSHIYVIKFSNSPEYCTKLKLLIIFFILFLTKSGFHFYSLLITRIIIKLLWRGPKPHQRGRQ